MIRATYKIYSRAGNGTQIGFVSLVCNIFTALIIFSTCCVLKNSKSTQKMEKTHVDRTRTFFLEQNLEFSPPVPDPDLTLTICTYYYNNVRV
jgi:hypothetical protein